MQLKFHDLGCGRFPGLSEDKLCIVKRTLYVQSSYTLNTKKNRSRYS